MNLPIIVGILLRHSLTAGGFYLAQRGVIDESEVDAVVGSLIALAGLLWSAYQKWKGGHLR